MKNDIWKDIGNGYRVSYSGMVKNKRGVILKTRVQNCGYKIAHIYLESGRRAFTVHRLVATAFIPNPMNKKQVNHKDGNKLNNSADNLEWCDMSYNVKHSFVVGLRDKSIELTRIRMSKIGKEYSKHESKCVRVYQYDLNGMLVCVHLSMRDAEKKLGFSRRNLADKIKSNAPYRGFIFSNEQLTIAI